MDAKYFGEKRYIAVTWALKLELAQLNFWVLDLLLKNTTPL